MTGQIVWRRLAELDVAEAAVYIADDNLSTAARFMDAVDDTVRALRKMPSARRPIQLGIEVLREYDFRSFMRRFFSAVSPDRRSTGRHRSAAAD